MIPPLEPARGATFDRGLHRRVEILNPDHVICTLDDGASIRMELTINNGKGYVPAEQNRPDDAPIGLIAVDLFGHPADYDALEPLARKHSPWHEATAAMRSCSRAWPYPCTGWNRRRRPWSRSPRPWRRCRG